VCVCVCGVFGDQTLVKTSMTGGPAGNSISGAVSSCKYSKLNLVDDPPTVVNNKQLIRLSTTDHQRDTSYEH
jgi:hypothetical protein